MSDLPPEDRPDTIDIGPVRGIPIHYEDDPRLETARAAWSAATATAQAMHTQDELLAGLEDDEWRVRHEVIPRLAVRGQNDPRTPAALARTLRVDPQWEVRDAAAMAVIRFDTPGVVAALREACRDRHEDVRSSAAYALAQLGYE